MSNPIPMLALGLVLALPIAAAPLQPGHAPQRPINLNAATVTELMQLPRIGQKTAERIVAFRKQHGGFLRPEEVMNVKGIGDKSFAKLKPYLTVSTPRPVAAPSLRATNQ